MAIETISDSFLEQGKAYIKVDGNAEDDTIKRLIAWSVSTVQDVAKVVFDYGSDDEILIYDLEGNLIPFPKADSYIGMVFIYLAHIYENRAILVKGTIVTELPKTWDYQMQRLMTDY